MIEQEIADTLETNYMPYAMSVIVSRAIPEIDGFKPSHRKLLYTMYTMGLLKGARTKSANIVGQTMKLNPHGDQAIYETMVRLTRGNETLLHPFIDSKGNFGKQYSRDMAYAASRYTEAKLAEICAEIFKDIDKNTVQFIDNYDGKLKEPMLLPTTYPNLLVTPNQGIAVGMASSIASFNLKEICAATIAYIKNPDGNLQDIIAAPDFSTGAEVIYNEKEIAAIYETGRGSFKLRAKWRFDKKNSLIEIYEIPYTTTIEAVMDKIIAIVKAGKIRDINDVRDETDLNGLKLTVEIKRSANPETLMHRLFAQTALMDTFSCNFNALIDGKPSTMGIREILAEWLIFRVGCIKRKLGYDLQKNKEKLHLLEGLRKIILDIDRAVKIVRETADDKMVVPNLMTGFQIDQIQAEFVAEIRLRNLNKEYLLNRINELDNLKNEIKNLNDILADEAKIKDIISVELKEVSKKYGQPRKTEIIYEIAHATLTDDDFIDDYGLKLFLTDHGYFKKISLVSLRSSGEQYLKEGDAIVQEIEATNKSDLLLFSNKNAVYKMKAHEMPDSKASAMGDYLANVLKLDEGEKIVFIAATTDYAGFLIFGFENGKVAKITMESYATKTNRKKLMNAYADKAPLIFADAIKEDLDYIAIRDADKATLFSSALIPTVSAKNSNGVQVLTLKKNSVMAMMMPSERFAADDGEYYRTVKIPSTGHFLTEKDKMDNDFTAQLKL
ncbi:MAG: topoisomerase IV [Clostridiales bacterium]|nr:topoisomerase IV [Clostridiales bacterium]